MDIDQAAIAYEPTTGVRRAHETPLDIASGDNLSAYGRLVDDPATSPIEIARWPAQGWRPVDPHSGDQRGVTGCGRRTRHLRKD